MKKLLLLISNIFIFSLCFAAPATTISTPNTFSANTVIASSQVNANFSEISNKYNSHNHTDITQVGTITTGTWNATAIDYAYLSLTGDIVNADINTSAGIVDTKLATISTAGKVLGASLNTLSGIPSGAGQIPIANLGTGTGSSSNYLRGDGSWQTISNLSNVVFCFGTSGGSHSANSYGMILNDSILAAATEIMCGYWAVNGTTYQTILSTKFKKIAGISTITIWCSIWNNGGAGSDYAICNVDIGAGTVSGSVNGTATRMTPEWKTFNLDVSGLTNGTTYDVLIQIKAATTQIAYLDSIIGIAS